MPSSVGASRPDGLAEGPIGQWVLEQSDDPKFPYRLRVYTRDRDTPVLLLFVQDSGRALVSTSSACEKSVWRRGRARACGRA